MNALEQAVVAHTGLSLGLFRANDIRKMPNFKAQEGISAFYKEHRVGILVYLRQEAYKEGCSLSEFIYKGRSSDEMNLGDIEDVLLGLPNLWADWVEIDLTFKLLGIVQKNT